MNLSRKKVIILGLKLHVGILISLIFNSGCVIAPDDPGGQTPGIYATVVDESNNPVAGAAFHYIFYVGTETISNSALFEFNLENSDTITMEIFNNQDKKIQTLYNKKIFPAGRHSIVYDVTEITNGIYFCQISGSSISKKLKFLALTENIPRLQTVEPFIISNVEGKFNIDYKTLGIGEMVQYNNGTTQIDLTIADSIKVVLLKDGYKTFIRRIILDTTEVLDITFHIEKN